MSSPMPHFDGATYEPTLDHDRLATLLERVRSYMADGRWHTITEITDACGGTEASVSARLRDLRKPKFGGLDVERRRVCGTDGLFEYRIAGQVSAAPATKSLGWKLERDGTGQPYLRSIPEGFTVCRVSIPVGGHLTPMYEAWDTRTSPARRLGTDPWQDQAKARAEAAAVSDPGREGGASRDPDEDQS